MRSEGMACQARAIKAAWRDCGQGTSDEGYQHLPRRSAFFREYLQKPPLHEESFGFSKKSNTIFLQILLLRHPLGC